MASGIGRADWHLRANVSVVFYLVAALISGAIQRGEHNGQPPWLTVHLLLLGAVTNAIITWSDHFISALLWTRSQNHNRQMAIILLLNISIVGVLISVSAHAKWLILFFASLMVCTIIYFLQGISIAIKRSLNKRFIDLLRYYQFAALFLLVGITLGVIDSFKSDEDLMQPRLALAHLHANLLGWVGITVIGTLVTLWPTVLRTPMHERAIRAAVIGLRFILTGTSLSILAAIENWQILFGISLAIYLIGASITLTPAILTMRNKQPDRPGSWMLLTGAIGFGVLLLADSALQFTYKSPERVLVALEGHIILLFTLFLFPTLLGALTYLLPVVLGRGPALNRELETILSRGWKWRLLILPPASLFMFFDSLFVNIGRAMVAISLGAFLLLVLMAMVKSARYRVPSQ
jgi:nitrite reductase (NO-forming)